MEKKELINYLNKTYHGRTINVIGDMSGSSFQDTLEVLKLLPNNIRYFLYQCDTKINKVDYIEHKSSLNQLKIYGCGGTEIQGSIDSVSKRNNFDILIITDGYTEPIDFDNVKNNVKIIITGAEQYSTSLRICGETNPTQIKVTL